MSHLPLRRALLLAACALCAAAACGLSAATALCAAPAVGPPIPPVPRDESVPDRVWDLTMLTLDVHVDPVAGTVAGSARYTLARLDPGNPSPVLPLRLDHVGIEVEGVTVAGAPAVWRADERHIVIDVPASPPASEVEVRYRATPRTGLHFRGPGQASPDTYVEAWSHGEGEDNRYWLPSFDHPNERFLYRGHITAPPGYLAITNPEVDLVTYLVAIAVAPYEVHREGEDEVWAPPGAPQAAIDPLLRPMAAMRAHLAARTGVPYPWGAYRQVVVQRFLYGAMENTATTITSSRVLTGPKNQATRPGIESLVAHEFAHQWFGDLLTCRDWHHLWLNEGFATYFAADWMAARTGTRDEAEWAEAVRAWHQASKEPGSLTGAWFLGSDTPRNYRVYVKGAAVLEMLRLQVHDATFWRGMERYVRSHERALVTTGDLQAAMEAESGQNLDWFFQQWTELPYVPKITSRWEWSAGQVVVHLHQEAGADRPLYTLPLSLEVGGAEGVRAEEVELSGGSLTVKIPHPGPVSWVAVNADGGLLLDLRQEQGVAAWAAQVQRSPTAYARLQAADALGEAFGADAAAARTALRGVLVDGSAPPAVRRAAAAGLGKSQDPQPLLAVLEAGDTPALLRLAAAEGLAASATTAEVDAIVAARAREPSGDVRAALLEALVRGAPSRGLAATRALLRSTPARMGFDEGAQDGELRRAVEGLGPRGEPGDLALLLATPVSRDRRTAGLRAATRIVSRMSAGPEREDARRRVARSAESLLGSRDLRERETAVAVLGEVGDLDSIPALERFRREEEVLPLLEAAAVAIQSVRARDDTTPPPAPNEVDARLRTLEERIDALEEHDRTWLGR